jgi:putative hydrolase of the HAD superfamily
MPLAIFDLDNTLIDRAGVFEQWAAGFVAGLGLDPAEATWLIAADGDGFAPLEAFVTALRDRYRLDGSVEALLGRLRVDLVALVQPDPAAQAALERLRGNGWTIAIATNGNTDQQWAKIRQADLESRVDAVAVSAEVGAAKPDRRMFEAAAQRCGARLADGGWMVGDCAERDIAGAQAVGLRTVWLRRGRPWDPTATAPDAIVDRVDQIAPILLGPAVSG